jgi:hypothetical protein
MHRHSQSNRRLQSLQALSQQLGQVGVAFSYAITATNNPTSYNARTPSGAIREYKHGLLSGTPAAGTDAGSPYSVTISATNSVAQGAQR